MSPAFDVPARRSRGIERPRVTQSIDDAGRARLAVVHGTAGAGKTTAMAQWARHTAASSENHVVWVALNRDDAEPTSFWNRIGGVFSRHKLFETEWVPVLDAVVAVRQLGELLSSSRLRLHLVLDDYHLTSRPVVDDQIRTLLSRVEGLRIVVGTRTLGDLQSVSTAVRIDTVLIDADALAFTLDESAQLVAASDVDPNGDVVTSLHALTLGWPLASLALLVELEREPERLPTFGQVSERRSTFVAEIVNSALESRAPEQRELLLRTALADEFTVEMAVALSGKAPDSIQAALQVVEGDGLGSWQIRSGVAWFRIHPLVRDELELRARSELEAQLLFDVSGTLSDLLLGARPLRALELAVAAEDWRRVEEAFYLKTGLLGNYHRDASGRLLFGIPRETLVNNPALVGIRLIYEFGMPQAESQSLRKMLSAANSAAQPLTPPSPTVASALGEVMWMGVNRLYGNEELAMAYAERAVAAITASPVTALVTHVEAVAMLHVQLGSTAFQTGDYRRALDSLRFAATSATASDSNSELYQAHSLLALVNAVSGNVVDATDWISRSQPAADAAAYDGWLGRYLGSARRLAIARVHLNSWDVEGANQVLASVEAQAEALEYWPDLLMARGWTDLMRIGPAAAHAALTTSIASFTRRAPALPVMRARMAALASLLLSMSGQPGRAAEELERPDLPQHTALDIMRARLTAANGGVAKAISTFDSISRSTDHSPQMRVEALLGLATAALASSHREQAVNAFATAIATMQKVGVRLPLITVTAAQLHELTALLRESGQPFDESVLRGVPAITSRAVQVSPLSKAERRVLAALVSTGDLTVAADALHLSEHTLRYHLKRSYRKLGVSSRSDAIARAQELGMLD